ncbi:MAG: ABC transporter ATP-binding protein [Oscillospiraceae bacterium]|nr:ABC transporter ATP-binding protein [Oscillospiraceae bacterium]
MLELKNIRKVYRPSGKVAVDNVSLSIGPGEVVGLFGENGAGKTTLMKSMLGLLRCEGEITLDGEPITTKNIARLSFATSEHSFFPTLTGDAHRDFYAEHFPKFDGKRYEALMEFFSLPKNKPVGKFSTGQKNQFEVILAVSQGADYIIMDEPFAGNDVFNREDFYKVLLGILRDDETIILSTHLMEEVEPFISRAVLLHKGKILGDESMEALQDQGIGLMDYVKATYNYRADRVAKALNELRNEEG